MNAPPDDFYKWAFALTFTLLIGVIVGQYTPNRSIVLRDELVQQANAQKASTDALTQSNEKLASRLESVETQLAAVDATLRIQGGANNAVHVQ